MGRLGNIAPAGSWVISFGSFRVTKARRLVERDGESIHLGSRAFDILTHLLEHAGQVVTHRALLTAAWPNIIVEDVSLRFQMNALRKALGSEDAKRSCIVNVPGRGYCFTAPISREDAEAQIRLTLTNKF
jgi:DNA-binding winged helix-turn-helix (wHTH) protein